MANSCRAHARNAQLSESIAQLVTVVVPVFRDALRAIEAVHKICAQRLSPDLQCQVVVVDDGSDDGTFERLQSLEVPGVEVLSLSRNAGRSGARNAGAQAAKGDVVVFMDCDCLPLEAGWLNTHYSAYRNLGVVAATGDVIGCDEGFWHRYQAEASNRRKKQHAEGQVFSGSSQNLSVRKSALVEVGGFDTGYTQYGFEDRDLLMRLSTKGSIVWLKDATVTHRDVLDMVGVVRKLRLSAGASAERFSRLHPSAYRKLGYAALDSRIHPAWRLIRNPLRHMVPYVANLLEGAISRNLLPFSVLRLFVKLVSGLAFVTGTFEAAPGQDGADA